MRASVLVPQLLVADPREQLRIRQIPPPALRNLLREPDSQSSRHGRPLTYFASWSQPECVAWWPMWL